MFVTYSFTNGEKPPVSSRLHNKKNGLIETRIVFSREIGAKDFIFYSL
jgi:hypothetical protein